ncbi:hypothetical protein AB0O01_29280 [Streptomyces sp. NPDC093252]|uniref:hypothetical protein n=1 Tax=Streptomyces sp. NPDC093252 TaxID=3154980 RepID=UPI00342A1E31
MTYRGALRWYADHADITFAGYEDHADITFAVLDFTVLDFAVLDKAQRLWGAALQEAPPDRNRSLRPGHITTASSLPATDDPVHPSPIRSGTVS